jgi:hypothetical protein
MSRSAISALMGAAFLSAAALGLFGETSAASTPASSATATAPSVEPKAPPAWVLGLARFSPADAGGEQSILLSTLPRLIIANLKSLPARRTPDEDAAEIARRDLLRARFAAGTELAAKLDARALSFLDPALDGEARKVGIISADRNLIEPVKKLDEATKETKATNVAVAEKTVSLWSGHTAGQLIDPPTSDLSKAAKAAGVDLLVTGSVALESGYAKVVVHGFDLSLGREVFAWKSFCSVDDPEPLAEDMASRLERWAAGRDFARLELIPSPTAAELWVNGELLSGSSRVVYTYSDGPVNVMATASGYAPLTTSFELALGDKKKEELQLEPLVTGSLSLNTDPPGASISLDSVPQGQSPLSIGLDGSRAILSASSEGREPQLVVLPASGDSSVDISLLPSDGLGPSGRISAAKDRFYTTLGWFVLSIPVTALTYGAYKGYDEAYLRSGSATMFSSRSTASMAVAIAASATATTAAFMIVRLVKYLRTAH